MRTIISTALTFACFATAHAEPADNRIGIGLGVGIATGPNLQLVTSSATHVDIGMGLELDDRLRLQADHAWRLVDLTASEAVTVPLYLGVGGFISDRSRTAAAGGLRMPLGVQADFSRAPIQVFGELSPELVVVNFLDEPMEEPPSDAVALTGLMGVRAAF